MSSLTHTTVPEAHFSITENRSCFVQSESHCVARAGLDRVCMLLPCPRNAGVSYRMLENSLSGFLFFALILLNFNG